MHTAPKDQGNVPKHAETQKMLTPQGHNNNVGPRGTCQQESADKP